jgi:uncharacterized membrane protein YcfT
MVRTVILASQRMANVRAAVPYASWTAFYDIRVDMDTKESPVTLIYKAAVKQNTGEVRNFVIAATGR